MTDYGKLNLMYRDMAYREQTGGTGIVDTLNTYSGIARLFGFAVGVTAGAYVANETMEWLASDAPAAVRYTVDGLAALIAGREVAKATSRIGLKMGINKVEKVLDEYEK